MILMMEHHNNKLKILSKIQGSHRITEIKRDKETLEFLSSKANTMLKEQLRHPLTAEVKIYGIRRSHIKTQNIIDPFSRNIELPNKSNIEYDLE